MLHESSGGVGEKVLRTYVDASIHSAGYDKNANKAEPFFRDSLLSLNADISLIETRLAEAR